MPNGTDCSCLLQTEPLHVPTQWVFFDLSEGGLASPWLAAEPTVDYLHLTGRSLAPDFLLSSYSGRLQQGYRGRQVVWFLIDAADPRSREWGLELPLELSNLMFWETNQVPSVLRALVGSAEDRNQLLAP